MQMALSMAFFTGIGYFLDTQLNSLPWITVVGGVLGMVAVFVQLYRLAKGQGAGGQGAGRRRHKKEQGE